MADYLDLSDRILRKILLRIIDRIALSEIRIRALDITFVDWLEFQFSKLILGIVHIILYAHCKS
jgi:hypothetical protein